MQKPRKKSVEKTGLAALPSATSATGHEPEKVNPLRRGQLKRESGATRFETRWTAAQKEELLQVAAEQNSCPTDIIRRAWEEFKSKYFGQVPLVLQMSGSPKILELKQKCLKAAKFLHTEPGMASVAGVTRGTVVNWLKTDVVFRDLVEEAQAACVSNLESMGYLRGLNKDKEIPPSVAFSYWMAIQNARNPEYGIIRPQMLTRLVDPLVERMLDLAQRYIEDIDNYERFAQEVTGYADDFVREQSAKKGGKAPRG